MCAHSVIAITGFGGHAFDSWRSRIFTQRPIDRPMWLRDFLPEKFPHARIMTYGYESGFKEPNRVNITDSRRSFIECLRNCRRHCPVSLCLTELPFDMLTVCVCYIESSHHLYRARFGRDPGCSGRRNPPKPNSYSTATL